MAGCVYAARPAGNHREPRPREQLAEPLGLLHAVMRAAPRADHADGDGVGGLEAAADVQQRGAVVYRFERGRESLVGRHEDRDVMLVGECELLVDVTVADGGDVGRDLLADSLDSPPLGRTGGEDGLGVAERLDETTVRDGPDTVGEVKSNFRPESRCAHGVTGGYSIAGAAGCQWAGPAFFGDVRREPAGYGRLRQRPAGGSDRLAGPRPARAMLNNRLGGDVDARPIGGLIVNGELLVDAFAGDFH